MTDTQLSRFTWIPFWRNVGAWDPRLIPTPAVARYTAPHAPLLWFRRSASGYDPPLAGLGRRPSLASRSPVRPPSRGPSSWPDASTATRPSPFFRSQVAIECVTHLLESLAP